MTDQSELAKAEDEAADWAVLLADDPDDADQRRAFNTWLNASPLNAEVWARTLRIHEQLGALSAATRDRWPATAPGGRRENPAIFIRSDSGRRKAAGIARYWHARAHSVRWVPLAVVTCLALVFLLPQLTLRLSADYFTGTGEQQTLVLADGSRLFLAPESAVDIAFSGGGRSVRLLAGSAFFEVQPDAGRPFHVDAGETRTTVLGTAFNVDKTDSGAVVSVAHGRVRVEDRSLFPRLSENLGAGDRLAVTRERGGSLTHTPPEEIALWRSGELVARNMTISAVVESFRRYYSGVILVAEPLASQRVTGLYRLDDPVDTLADMAEAHGATLRRVGPWLLVLSQ